VGSLAETLRPAIEANRAEAETQRRLPMELVETLRGAGAFRLSTPIERDGFELSVAAALDVYEAFGHVDGPVAWNIWNGNLGFTAALLSAEAGDQIWSRGADPIIANSARVAGTGVPGEGGYVVSGRWDIVSAIDIADWVALFGVVMQGDAPRIVNGAPDVRVFFLRTGDVRIVDTWHTSGMRGTGSKSVVVDQVVVPEEMAISPFSPSRIDRPLFRVPAFTLASTGAAPIVVGIAQAALDELIDLAPRKASDNGRTLAQLPHVHAQLAVAQTSLHAARLVLRDAATTIDAAATANEPVTEMLRARLRAAMSHAASVSREVLITCQLLASSSAIYTDDPIERLVRDGMVAAQHKILSPTHMDILGRLTLGLDAGTPIV
jgi:alkylation response protein AidB-like acyl-CoA dehydrogenase